MTCLVKVSHYPGLWICANLWGRNAFLSAKVTFNSSQVKVRWWGREWKEWIYLNKIDNTAANVCKDMGQEMKEKNMLTLFNLIQGVSLTPLLADLL